MIQNCTDGVSTNATPIESVLTLSDEAKTPAPSQYIHGALHWMVSIQLCGFFPQHNTMFASILIVSSSFQIQSQLNKSQLGNGIAVVCLLSGNVMAVLEKKCHWFDLCWTTVDNGSGRCKMYVIACFDSLGGDSMLSLKIDSTVTLDSMLAAHIHLNFYWFLPHAVTYNRLNRTRTHTANKPTKWIIAVVWWPLARSF